MKKNLVIFFSLFFLGISIRFIAASQLNWFFGSSLHVDEITYTNGNLPPFDRPPGTYLLTSFFRSITNQRILFSVISLIPSLIFFFFRKKSSLNSIIAGVLAIEPTLAFSGLQLLPSAPAAALLSSAIVSLEKKPKLAGWLIGTATLFRGELLMFVPISILFIHPVKKYLHTIIFVIIAVLPVFTVNFLSGGSFALAKNGSLNLWVGSTWQLLETPPGIEFEELMGQTEFTKLAEKEILKDIPGWLGRGAIKTAAFFSLPGPGRNIEADRLLISTILKLFLPVTLLFLALGLSAFRKDAKTALIVTAILSAFIFFPSIRHRAVFIPVFAILATNYRLKIASIITVLIILFSVFLKYPASVRTGLTELQLAQNELENNNYESSLEWLKKSEDMGYVGADIHSIRGAVIASSGGEFHEAALEFSRVLEMTPNAPSAWKNMSVFLYNYGHIEDAIYAAQKAVNLNPDLREELVPILEQAYQ